MASDGAVQVWFDGKDMGKHHFSTLPHKEALMFTQIGILRSQQDAVEEILIDAAYEASSMAELLERQADTSGISSVPTLFEQIQLISQICRNFVLDGSRKQLIQRDSLEHRQAQDL